MTSIFTVLIEKIGLGHKDDYENDSATKVEKGEAPSINYPQREYSNPRDNKLSENRYGQFKPLVDSLRSALERFAIGELQGHRAINPNLRCRVSLIEIRPLNEEASIALRALLGIHRPTAIGEFIERNILASLTNGRHFDFSDFGGLAPIGLDTPSESESLIDPLLAEFGRSNTHTADYDITINWDPIDGREPDEVKQDETEHDEWILHTGNESSSRKLPRPSAKTPLTIGKSEKCDIVVSETFVSSVHGKLWFDNGQWWYVDNVSTNGSCVRRPKHAEVIFPIKAETMKERPSPAFLPPGSRIFISAIVEEGTPYLELKPGLADSLMQSNTVGTPVKPPPKTEESPTPKVR